MHKPFVFVPLLANRARRVTLGEYIRHLTKNPIVDCPLKSICPREKSHMAAIDAVHHPVGSNGRLLPFLLLPDKEVWDKDPLHAEADNKVLIEQLTAAHHVFLTAASPIARDSKKLNSGVRELELDEL